MINFEPSADRIDRLEAHTTVRPTSHQTNRAGRPGRTPSSGPRSGLLSAPATVLVAAVGMFVVGLAAMGGTDRFQTDHTTPTEQIVSDHPVRSLHSAH